MTVAIIWSWSDLSYIVDTSLLVELIKNERIYQLNEENINSQGSYNFKFRNYIHYSQYIWRIFKINNEWRQSFSYH